ncbi:MAG: hypothetical protein RL685_4022 [Pseudomonadota bacterium]|jgi:hypothetical protein
MSSARKSSRGFTVAGALGLVFGVLLGCPLYDDDCSDEKGCARGFVCDRLSTRCMAVVIPPDCTRPADCAAAETCTPDFECRPGSCDFHGCVTGFACGVVDGAHACVAPVVDAGTDAGSSPTDAAAAALPTDAGDAAVVPPLVVDAGGDAAADASF